MSVRNKCLCHKLSIAYKLLCAPPPPQPPFHGKITVESIYTIMPLCQNELLPITWRKTLINFHQIMLFWNHRNPAGLMHLLLCNMLYVVAVGTTVPSVVEKPAIATRRFSPVDSDNQTAFKVQRLFLLLSGNSDQKDWKFLKIENLEKANYT